MKKSLPEKSAELSFWTQSAAERQAIGYNSRIFVQCNLPYKNPGDDLEYWHRTNGNASLILTPLMVNEDGERRKYGFPYGSIPRLIIFYLITEAIKTQEKEVLLGNHISDFMNRIGLKIHSDNYRRLKEQMLRLFNCSIRFSFGKDSCNAGSNVSFVKDYFLWWNEDITETQPGLFQSCIHLDAEFYEEITKFGFPLDLDVIGSIKKSPLALDLYSWATYRNNSLTEKTFIPWKSLHFQFGNAYKREDNFVSAAKKELLNIKKLWPDMKISETRGGIHFSPSKPQISKKKSVHQIPININRENKLYKAWSASSREDLDYYNRIKDLPSLKHYEREDLEKISPDWENDSLFLQMAKALLEGEFGRVLSEVKSHVLEGQNIKTDSKTLLRSSLLTAIKTEKPAKELQED